MNTTPIEETIIATPGQARAMRTMAATLHETMNAPQYARLGPGYRDAATRAIGELAGRVTAAEQYQAARRGWGHQFTASPAWVTRRGYTTAQAVDLPGYLEARQAAPDGRELFLGRPSPEVSPIAARCTPLPVGRLSAEYPRFTAPPPVPREQGEGELKAQGGDGPGLELQTRVVPYIATWLPVSRATLDDLGALAALVDGRLRRSLGLAVDAAVAVALSADADIPSAAGPDLAAAIRAGVLDLIADGYAAPAVLATPADAGAVSPADLPAGVPLLPTRALPAGTALVADLGAVVLLASKNDPQVMVTDSNAGDFVKNELVLLGEVAAAALVSDPFGARKIEAA